MISVKRDRKKPVAKVTGSYKYKNDKATNIEMMKNKIERFVEKGDYAEAFKLLKTLKLANQKVNALDEKTIKKIEALVDSIKPKENENEQREYKFEDIEVRALDDSEDLTISGYVQKWGSLSEPLKRGRKVFRERVEKGAFTKAIDRALANDKHIKLLFKHDHNKLLASTKNGSLQLEEDEIGLRFTANIVATSLGKDVYKYVKSGLMSNMSFGFNNAEESWSYENGENIRTLHDFNITEISILDNPAYKSSIVE